MLESFGEAATDESMGDEIRVLLVLTGVKSDQIHGAALHTQMRTTDQNR